MRCLAHDIGAFVSQRGRGTGTTGPTFSVLPIFITRLRGRVGARSGSPGESPCHLAPPASPGSSGEPCGFSGLVWTLRRASNGKAELALSPQTLEIPAVTALVTRVDAKI